MAAKGAFFQLGLMSGTPGTMSGRRVKGLGSALEMQPAARVQLL